MGIRHRYGMLPQVLVMYRPFRSIGYRLAVAALLAAWSVSIVPAKSYSSGGGHSYSSHSSSSGGGRSFSSGSHSFSSGSSHGSSSSSKRSSSATGSSGGSNHSSPSGSSRNFNASSGKSYSSGSTWSGSSGHSYTSGKSYSSAAGQTFKSTSQDLGSSATPTSPVKAKSNSSAPAFSFDSVAAHARKEEASQAKYTEFKRSDSGTPSPVPPVLPTAAHTPSYQVKAPSLPSSASGSYRPTVYVPEPNILTTRPARVDTIFNPYYSRPWVTYHDPYNSLFWWWLLDRSLDDRAWWAYHHRYDMDPARYQTLLAKDQQLEARVEQLEAQQPPRDPTFVPAGLDRDLMYSDQYVTRAYSTRPTTAGIFAFWVLAIPTALAVCAFFIWLIWFKRWQTAA
jgi:hypothetical protein